MQGGLQTTLTLRWTISISFAVIIVGGFLTFFFNQLLRSGGPWVEDGQPMPAPAPAPPPPPSPLDAVLDKLIAGNIAFNTPDHVRIGKPRIIEAKLAVNIPPNVLIAQLREAGKKESASIAVADRMAATLYGGTAFDVSPSGPQQQFISHQQVTSWTWEVTAKQAGTQFLILSLDAVLTVDGKEGTRNINTFTRKIEVEVAWPETPLEWFQWVKEWFENVSWLWVTVLVPLGLWAWNRFRKKPPSEAGPDVRAKDKGSSEV